MPTLTLFARLESLLALDESTGCLIYTGPLTSTGYGKIYGGAGRAHKVYAHRIAYEMAYGPIPAGLEVDHLCKNRNCCNPDHLEAVTHAENLRRSPTIATVNAAKTHCKRGHEFTPENTMSHPTQPGSRVCRQCKRLRNKARNRSKAA